jgi:hypothetical protein
MKHDCHPPVLYEEDDILESMGSEIRTTAQSVFGSRLEGLESVRVRTEFTH